jgi:hypothetical protein
MGEVFIYKDNTGGTCFSSNEMNINQSMQRTEMALIQNMEIYREGGFQAQKGNRQINTGAIDETAVLGIVHYQTAGTTYAIFTKASGKAYVMDASGGAENEIKTGLNASAIPQFVEFEGKCGVFNGSNTPFFANGTTNPGPDVTTPHGDWATTKPHTVCNLRDGRILAAAASTLYYCKQGDENNWTAVSDAGTITDMFSDVTKINAISNYDR